MKEKKQQNNQNQTKKQNKTKQNKTTNKKQFLAVKFNITSALLQKEIKLSPGKTGLYEGSQGMWA